MDLVLDLDSVILKSKKFEIQVLLSNSVSCKMLVILIVYYRCKHCGKAFARIVYLQGHLRSHSDERPFPCHICPSSFKTKAHLVKHLSSIHKELMQSVVTMIKEELEASG